MRIRLFACVCFALLIANAPGARAGDIYLYWNDCSPFRGGAGVTSITDDCSSNSGSLVLVASVVPPPGITGMDAMSSELFFRSTAPVLPAWWQMQTSGCRVGAISFSTQSTGLSACAKAWSPNALGGYAYDTGAPCCPSPNVARLRIVAAMPPADSVAMSPSVEYYAFQVFINRSKSIGDGSCEGCATPTCIELSQIGLFQPSRDTYLTGTDQHRFVTYNGEASICPTSTPVHNRTWGAVKATYR
jgi:hypothetical protein